MSTPKRVLHLHMTDNLGGIVAFQYNMYQHIDREKIQFDFIVPHEEAVMEPTFRSLGAKVYKVPPEKTVFAYCHALKKVLKENPYDIVHIHKNSCANIMPFLVCKKLGIKHIIAHSHNTMPVSGGILSKAMHHMNQRKMLSCMTDAFACSEKAGKWLFGEQSDKAIVLRNGIDLSRFSFNESIRVRMRNELGIGDRFVIGHVGNYIEQKNHPFILEIFKEFHHKHPKSVLILLGGGASMEKIKQYAKTLGIEKDVMFLGAKMNSYEYYQAMDAYLFPSLHEGLPIAGVEAQAANLPCFFSDRITRELQVTDDVYWLSLNQKASEWAEQIAKIAFNHQRKDTSEQLIKSGYDSRDSARKLQEFYLSKAGG